MIKRLKTIEQIKSEWLYKIEDIKDIRFYGADDNLFSHITYRMREYFGKEINVTEIKSGYYEWFINDNSYDTKQIWHFKDEWFVDIIKDLLLEDELFEI